MGVRLPLKTDMTAARHLRPVGARSGLAGSGPLFARGSLSEAWI